MATLIDSYKEIENIQERAIWKIIDEKFQFNPHYSKDKMHYKAYPVYKEPKGSITVSLTELFSKYDDEEQFEDLESEINEYFLGIFKNITLKPIYAMDWQHACYVVDIHKMDMGEYIKTLRNYSLLYTKNGSNYYIVSVVPDGDYHMFFTDDFNEGVLGHPWEPSICLFGKQIINFFEKTHPKILSNILRKN